MAILDRPLFRRPLTKDELRAYGIPAFANGGVVKKFQTGGKVDLGYTESGAISSKPIFKPFGPLTRAEYDALSPEEVFKVYTGQEPSGLTGEDILSSINKYISENYSSGEIPGALQSTLELEKEQREREVKGGAADIRKKEREREEFKTIGEILDEAATGEQGTTKIRPEEEQKKKDEEMKKLIAEAEKNYEEPGALSNTKALEEEMKNQSGGNFTTTGNTTTSTTTSDLNNEKNRMSKLQKLVKERSALYKELLGDPSEQLRQQGFLQLAQFGLNLAAARGGNLAEKIAKSATDPLQTFAALARDAAKDERAITAAAIEAGEKQLTTEIETAADISPLGKTIRDIAEMKGLSIEGAFAEYERLQQDQPEVMTNFEKWSAAGELDQYGGDAGKARAVGVVPTTVLRSTDLIMNDEGTGYDKGKIATVGETSIFAFKDEKGNTVAATLKPGALQKGGKKDPLTVDDFEILDVDIFRF